MASKHLQSWSDTAVTRSIIDFVEKVTDPGSPSYVEPRDRIAVFDNDGTLWCEKPFVQGGFITQRMAEMARMDPSLQRPTSSRATSSPVAGATSCVRSRNPRRPGGGMRAEP